MRDWEVRDVRFTDTRQVDAPVQHVWTALHDTAVLSRVIPGCQALTPITEGRYAATLAAKVGRLADTYRGTFAIDDTAGGSELLVTVSARGRCGSLELDLDVCLTEGASPGTTSLAYDARARVGGLVSRLGPALWVAGGHLTGSFFRDLDRAVRRPVARQTAAFATV